MAIRYFVRFTEGRKDLLISDSPRVRIFTSFSQGVNVHRYGGHARKRDALKYIEEVNKAVGAQIAHYHGAVAV
jgi:hypothetical protein